MTTHATWRAITALSGANVAEMPMRFRACDWAPAPPGDAFDETSALYLAQGDFEGFDALPTCPECAVLVDLALTLRGAP